MLILAPLGQATITERSLTLASAWVRQARYVTPQSQDVFVKLSGSCSPCFPHRNHRGGPALIGRQNCVPASSGKSQSSQRHQDSQPVFLVVFRRQIAHVAVSADLLQREPPRLYGLLSPEPLHVQVPHSLRSNSVVHSEVRGTVREYFQLRLHSSLNQQLDSLQASRCRTSCSVQLCLPALESRDVVHTVQMLLSCSDVTPSLLSLSLQTPHTSQA